MQMHKKQKLYVGLVLILAAFILLVGFSKQTKASRDGIDIHLVIDFKNLNELPEHFRKTTDKINIKDSNVLNLYGLASLKASGSGQFAENSLILLKQSIGNELPVKIVDLRQESHGFINGIAVSWEGKNNKANSGLTRKEVLDDESTKLKDISLGKPISIYHNEKPQIIIPSKVQDEEELVNNLGISYIRIPVTDGERPTDDMVDYFVQFVKELQSNIWLHFHCKAGVGRTTMFMVMYDSMKNAKSVSLEDIMNRQVLLGGENLLSIENSSDDAKKRAEFIREFFKYCVNNNDNFRTTWTQWLKIQGE